MKFSSALFKCNFQKHSIYKLITLKSIKDKCVNENENRTSV